MISFTERGGTVCFSVRAQPRASMSQIVGEFDGALRINVAAPPVDGAANRELVKLIAKLFGVAQSDVEIRAGAHARQKLVRVHGLEPGDAERVLGRF
jgi:uncharacterized protein (TIGR00251 family)